MDIKVIGAAIAGPAAALRLAQEGHRVTVYEARQAEELFSAGILGITHGIWDRLAWQGVRLSQVELDNGFTDYNSGEFVYSPFRYVAWTDLHRMLVTMCDAYGVRFEYGRRMDVDSVTADLVVDATGVAGAARRKLVHRYSGFTIYRGLAPRDIPDAFVAFQMNPEGYFTIGHTPYGAFWAMFARRPEPARLTTTETTTPPPETWTLPPQFAELVASSPRIAVSPMSDWHVPQRMTYGRCIQVGDVNGAVRPVTTSGANLAVMEGFAAADLAAGNPAMERRLLDRRQYDLELGALLMGPEIGGAVEDGMYAEHHAALFGESEA